MLKSMTGFGRYELITKERKITVEMKSVNHKYCDISIKMPKKLNAFESAIRNLLKRYVQRGKIDIFINYEDYTENNIIVKYNEDIAGEYVQYFNKMSEKFNLENDITVSKLARYPDVFLLEEQTIDEEKIWELLKKAIISASEKFVETRILEGENLKKDLIIKTNEMLDNVEFIELRSPQIIKEYRERITDKVNELLGDNKIEESVLATEITIFADKICVDEETVRLRSHIENLVKTLEEGLGIGRKLDFIAQEMNREANTILSKANDLEVSNKAIDLKTEIEKVREQIQNIE